MATPCMPGSVSTKKWHCDGWQEKIHGRDLVYFGERALIWAVAFHQGEIHITCWGVQRLLISSLFGMMIPIITSQLYIRLSTYIYIYTYVCIVFRNYIETHNHSGIIKPKQNPPPENVAKTQVLPKFMDHAVESGSIIRRWLPFMASL